jgi:hypothetical protein
MGNNIKSGVSIIAVCFAVIFMLSSTETSARTVRNLKDRGTSAQGINEGLRVMSFNGLYIYTGGAYRDMSGGFIDAGVSVGLLKGPIYIGGLCAYTIGFGNVFGAVTVNVDARYFILGTARKFSPYVSLKPGYFFNENTSGFTVGVGGGMEMPISNTLGAYFEVGYRGASAEDWDAWEEWRDWLSFAGFDAGIAWTF